MADFASALFRIDPTQGLVDYVQTVKPYHSKILDILVEYVYTEAVNTTMNERWSWCMEFTRPGGYFSGVCTDGVQRAVPGGDLEYSCGYGYLWDPSGLTSPEAVPTSRIVSALGKLLLDVTTTPNSSTIGILRNVSGHPLQPGDPIVFQNIPLRLYNPTAEPDFPVVEYITPGQTYFVITATPSSVTVSDTIVNGVPGSPFVIGSYTLLPGESAPVLQILPQGLQYNSFLVEPTINTATYDCLATSTTSNQITFIDAYDITGVDTVLKQWRVAVGAWTPGSGYPTGIHSVPLLGGSGPGVIQATARVEVNSAGQVIEIAVTNSGTKTYNVGDVLTFVLGTGIGSTFTVTVAGLTLVLAAQDPIFINGNSTAISNGKFTVDTIQGSVITVNEQIPPLTNSSGSLYVPDVFNNIPYWPAGLRVKVHASGLLPGPLVDGGTYYFAPSSKIGAFGLALTRYPREFSDFIDITSVSNPFTIERAEPFTPGDVVGVFGTQNYANNGDYTVATVDTEGAYFRIGVMQNVARTTPTPSPTTYDGAMTSVRGTYDMPNTCPAISTPDFYASTYIDENLQFTFTITEHDFIGTSVVENDIAGWGSMSFGTTMSPYGTGMEPIYGYTAMTDGISSMSGTHLILPTGFDTQFFDVGAIDETMGILPTLHNLYPAP